MSKAIDLENGLPAIKTWVEGKFQQKESGKGLSTNDYTTDEKTKLAGIAAGAEVNVQADWNVTSTTSDAYIKNKPSIPAPSSTAPKMDGTAAAGTGTTWARADHVHPTDTSRAPLASPALTGTPTAPTAAAGTNTTQIATTEFVKTAVDNVTVADFTPSSSSADGTHGLVPAPPRTVQFLRSDEGWAYITAYDVSADDGMTQETSTVQDYLSELKDLKVDKETGKGLSTNDYTTTEKNKLANIAAGAQVNVIESVKVNGTALSISSKAVNVPKATNSVYGATILSDATDGTAAAASGGTAATPKAVADALAAAKTYADGLVTNAIVYKGSVATYADLPASPSAGDMYNVVAAYGDYPAGTNWAWTGTVWDALGGSFTITYATAAEVTAVLNA